MPESLHQLDQSVFLALNGAHSPFWDYVMWWISNKYIWSPMYLFLVYLLWKKYKNQIWIVLIFTAVLITVTIKHICTCSKHVWALRPTHNPELEGMVHYLRDYKGGQFGFVSGHAANSMAIAVFVSVLLDKTYKWMLPVMLFWGIACRLQSHIPGGYIIRVM